MVVGRNVPTAGFEADACYKDSQTKPHLAGLNQDFAAIQ